MVDLLSGIFTANPIFRCCVQVYPCLCVWVCYSFDTLHATVIIMSNGPTSANHIFFTDKTPTLLLVYHFPPKFKEMCLGNVQVAWVSSHEVSGHFQSGNKSRVLTIGMRHKSLGFVFFSPLLFVYRIDWFFILSFVWCAVQQTLGTAFLAKVSFLLFSFGSRHRSYKLDNVICIAESPIHLSFFLLSSSKKIWLSAVAIGWNNKKKKCSSVGRQRKSAFACRPLLRFRLGLFHIITQCAAAVRT